MSQILNMRTLTRNFRSNLRKNTLVATIFCFVLILLWKTTSSSYQINSTFEEVQFDPDYKEPNFDEPENIIANVPKKSKSRELERQKQVFEHKIEDEQLKTDETQQDVQSPVIEKQIPRTKVLLITAHRSGSTFLGELFNRNNDAFYLFEPLAAVQVRVLYNLNMNEVIFALECQFIELKKAHTRLICAMV